MEIGTAADGHDNDCAVVIRTVTGPNTRSLRKRKLAQNLYGYHMIFTHNDTKHCNVVKFTAQGINELEETCLRLKDRPRSRRGIFTLARSGPELSLRIKVNVDLSTLLVDNTIDLIMASIRVKRFLDREARQRPDEYEMHNIRARELNVACAHLTAKWAVDTLTGNNSKFPRQMSQKEYNDQVKELDKLTFRRSFRTDCVLLTESLQEALRQEWKINPRFLTFYVHNIAQSWNPFNEPLSDLNDEHLLVLGVWQLQFG